MTIIMSREEKIAILDRYYARTGGGKEFAEEVKLPLKTIYNWSTQDKKLWRPTKQIGKEMAKVIVANSLPPVKDSEEVEYWKHLYLQEKEKVDSLQKVVIVMGHQL